MKRENKKEIREKILKGLEMYQEKLIETKKAWNLELVVLDAEELYAFPHANFTPLKQNYPSLNSD